MPTQTERHLQVIAEKIETIQNIHAEVGIGAPSAADAQSVIGCLKTIRECVRHLPCEFKMKYCNVSWVTMSAWGMPGCFSANNLNNRMLNIIAVFYIEIKPRIYHYAGGDTEIQKSVISNLQAQYEELSKNWHAQISTLYVLISITGILTVIRLGIERGEIDFTLREILSYGGHVGIAVCVAFYMQCRPSITPFAEDISNWFYTYTDFFRISHENWNFNIANLAREIKRHENIKIAAIFFWLWTLIVAFLFTDISTDYNSVERSK